jgi:hypothetical protein
MVLRKKYSLPFFNYSFYYFVWVMICAYTVLIILLQLRDIIGLLFFTFYHDLNACDGHPSILIS